ncbi:MULTISPECIES: GGDEF domain-containing protein [Acidiphilium]|uniref:diguanylate cyclase n=1 Tax=Acidiphilium rubrum TaxID=526 RepID=A0A8G2FL60_ACIRU|nr:MULTISPECIES: GGDEF domain-containing protein [Acidiphilium]SIQ18086.1 diguanylate cyclase (GGDEF) domain-containing protein [Acidiphilium rubrum]
MKTASAAAGQSSKAAPPHQVGGSAIAKNSWVLLARIVIVAGLDDLLFVPFFLAEHSVTQAAMNLFSAGLYAVIHRLLKHRRNRLAVALIWAEVFGHATIGTLLSGWNSGYFFYLLMFVPTIAISMPRRRAIILIAWLWAYFIALMILAATLHPLAPIGHAALVFLQAYNATVLIGMVTYFTLMYRRLAIAAEQKLQRLATTDPLTGLLNRRSTIEMAARSIAAAERGSADLSFILVDIDHFKLINDRFGHKAGDGILTTVAAELSELIRGEDILARWGGEEFLVVLPDTPIEGAAELATRFQERLTAFKPQIGDIHVSISLTMGISTLAPGESFDAAVARADQALYRGKDQGRNRIILDTGNTGSPQDKVTAA